MHKGNSALSIILLLAILIAGGWYVYYKDPFSLFGTASPDIKACSQEAMICPDGSAVTRTGPNCEFAPCSTSDIEQQDMSDWKTYRNEEYGFEVRYPTVYELKEPGLSGPARSGWKLLRPTADYLKGNWLELRFYLMLRDSEEGKQWISSFGEEGDEYVESAELFSLDDKQLKRRKASGVYGSEQILWLEPHGKLVVLFAISPVRSEFLQEAYDIIKSIKFIN